MKTHEKIEFFVLTASILFAAVVSVLDIVKTDEKSSWLTMNLPAITLLLLSLIAQSLVLSSYKSSNKLEKIEEQIARQSVSHKKFDTDTETMEYIIKRIKSASCVYDLSWLPSNIDREISRPRRDAYWRTIADRSKEITYREIMIFYNQDRIAKAEYLIKHSGSGYELGYYEQQAKDSPMLLQFIMFDEEEVIFSRHAIKGKEFVSPLVGYYNNIWKGSKKIKFGKSLDEKILKIIAKKTK